MRKKNWVLNLGLLFISIFFISAVASAQELLDIQSAIQAKRAKWIAAETSISKLPHGERLRRLGLIPHTSTGRERILTFQVPPSSLPATLDWRNNGGNFVTPIRDQGACGSCWAFATTAALESYTLISHNFPNIDLNLAEQILLSCSDAGNCENGGFHFLASDYIRDRGLPAEDCYPYTGTNGDCSRACSTYQSSTYKIANWSWVATYSITVEALKNALFNYGPLVTTMAVYADFFYYQAGVYSYTSGDFAGYHAIFIVGYDDANKYFIVKNSWGTGWGESGYFRIAYSELNSVVHFGDSTIAYTSSNPTCNYSLSQFFTASGGVGSVKVTTPSECSWTAVSNDASWITIISGSDGTGSGTVTYSVSPNNSNPSRTGTLTIADQTYIITQESNCTYAISPTSQSFSSSGGSGSVSVTAPSGCSWTAVSNASWITITSGSSGSGNGTVHYSASANTNTSSRTGTMTIADNTFTVNQAGAGGPPSPPTNVSASDGTYTDKVRVTWTASSGATGYKVFRSTSNDPSGAQQIGTSNALFYDDMTAVEGTTYWYWVKAYNSAGDSGFSNGDSGYVAYRWQSEPVNWSVYYGNNWNRSGTVTKPGAVRIRLHFSMISVEVGYDHLRTDVGDDWSGDYGNVTSHEKASNSIGLTLTSDWSRNGYFTIDRVDWQGPSTGPAVKSGTLFQ
jgi:C1A family cysteine protease